MTREFRLPLIVLGIVLLGLATVVLLQTDTRMFFDGDFAPHGQCLLWDPTLLRVYTVSDLLIGLSYAAIALILTYLVYKARHDIVFPAIFLAFGAFIFFCGLTHFMDVITLWTPIYWTESGTKVLTAFASVTTALALPPIVPRILGLVDAAKKSSERKRSLIEANKALEIEIAQRRRAEEKMRTALEHERQLNEFRRQFIIRMSHEFRTPLAIARTSSDLLKIYGDQLDGKQRTERLDSIQKQIEQMTSLLDDILSAGRFQAGQSDFSPVPTDLNDLCRHLLERFASSPIKIEFKDAAECTPARLDSDLIERALWNVLENAISYSPKEGRIQFTLTCTAEQAILRIEDEGSGIAQEDRERIFDYFYRGKNAANISGTGLGLSIARQIIELHGGKIMLDEQQQTGSAFIIHLPLG